eukprot:c16964_g1_i3.p1 GENE.c16964_g1_i3~~c16964_g1_i3.p1  ORF type:complete len:276 (+),score=54.14 c16964_g1_i3:657-1484(+)
MINRQNFVGRARVMATQFTEAEVESFRVVLKARSFFESSISHTRKLPEYFDDQRYEDAHELLVEMTSKLDELAQGLQNLKLQVESIGKTAQDLIGDATRLRRKYDTQAADRAETGGFSESERIAMTAIALMTGPALWVAGASVGISLVAAALTRAGTEVIDHTVQRSVEAEVEQLRLTAAQFGLGQSVLDEAHDAILSFRGTLEMYHHQMTESSESVTRMRGGLARRRRAEFVQRVEFAQEKFRNILDGYNKYIDAYTMPNLAQIVGDTKMGRAN